MGNYFDHQPEVQSHPEKLPYRLKEETLSLWADDGVFSKRGLDIGTQVLLLALKDELPKQFASNSLNQAISCLDLGCGMGVIPCFLHGWISGLQFTAIDINQRACHLAERNFAEQRVDGKVFCRDGCAFLPDESFDIIVTNPPVRIGKQAMYDLLRTAISKLKPNGHMYLVIGKKQGAESLQKFLQELVPQVNRISRESGFWVLHLQK